MNNSDAGLDIHKHIVEARCRKCEKLFIPAPFHVFKDDRGYYCSWTCYNRREQPKDRRYNRVNQYTPEGVLIKTFPSTAKAAESIGVKSDRITKACRSKLPYRNYLWRYETNDEE